MVDFGNLGDGILEAAWWKITIAMIVVAACVAVVVRRRFAAGKAGYRKMLTMEEVMTEAKGVLSARQEADCVALSLYETGRLPEELAAVVQRVKLPDSARYVLILVQVNSNEPQRVCRVFIADQLEESLFIVLKDGILKVER